MKTKILAFALVLFIMLAPVIVLADNIRVTPVGEPHTGMAIITGSPASLETYSTNGKTITQVWLIIIIDEDTYNGLTGITITDTDGPSAVDPGDFSDPVPPPSRIPEATDTNCLPASTYPGCTVPQTNYEVSAILDQMGQVNPKPTSVRYVLVYAFDSVDENSKEFTVEVDSTHINVLILAQGKDGETTVLNENSPFSGSTLVVPEPATIAAVATSIGAFGLYAYYRKRKQ